MRLNFSVVVFASAKSVAVRRRRKTKKKKVIIFHPSKIIEYSSSPIYRLKPLRIN